jgi:hypothetical protein
MNQLSKKTICLLTLIIPYSLLLVYLISSLFENDLFTLLPIVFISLLPFSVAALILKKVWKVKFEDGSLKGDLTLLFFGTLAFIGIFSGFFCWMYMMTILKN